MIEEMHRGALETFSLTFGRTWKTSAFVELFVPEPAARMTSY